MNATVCDVVDMKTLSCNFANFLTQTQSRKDDGALDLKYMKSGSFRELIVLLNFAPIVSVPRSLFFGERIGLNVNL